MSLSPLLHGESVRAEAPRGAEFEGQVGEGLLSGDVPRALVTNPADREIYQITHNTHDQIRALSTYT